MRLLPGFVFLLLLATAAYGQKQEEQFIDRLLRPNLNVSNPAQGKTFNMGKTATVKSAHTKAFHARNVRPGTRAFTTRRELATQEYAAFLFRDGSAEARPSKQSYRAHELALTPRTMEMRSASEGRKQAQTQSYAANRPFRGRGKSQDALSQKDTPLTIEQVRELLNRNK